MLQHICQLIQLVVAVVGLRDEGWGEVEDHRGT